MSVIPRIMTMVRWIARMWACLVALIVVLVLVLPDPNAGPGAMTDLSIVDIIGLGFYALAALGLLLAWRFELVGGLIAIAGVIGHDAAFYIRYGISQQYIRGNLTIGFVFIIPAVLFILCWGLSRKKQTRADHPAQ